MTGSKKWNFLLLNASIYIFCFIALYYTSQLPESLNKIDVGSAFFPTIVLWLVIIVNTIVMITEIVANKKLPIAEQSGILTKAESDQSGQAENEEFTEELSVETIKEEGDSVEHSTSVVRFIAIVSMLTLYIYSWNFIDYKISTAILTIVIMYMLKVKSWKIFVFVTAGLIATIYAFFELIMRIPLP